jgi:hypothetical protein
VSYPLELQQLVEDAHQGHTATRMHLVADRISVFPIAERDSGIPSVFQQVDLRNSGLAHHLVKRN